MPKIDRSGAASGRPVNTEGPDPSKGADAIAKANAQPASPPPPSTQAQAPRQGFVNYDDSVSTRQLKSLFASSRPVRTQAATAAPTPAPGGFQGGFRGADLARDPRLLQRLVSAAPSGATGDKRAAGAQGSMVNSLWRGGPYAFGANVRGRYSEKASYGGQPGIGHPRFATTSDGGDLVLSVTGLRGKNPQATRVMALDADGITRANGGQWPETPEKLAAILKGHPEMILADVQADPPAMNRISGIPAGKNVTVLTGAEAIMGTPPQTPPPSQAMVTNFTQIPAEHQLALGGPATSPPAGRVDPATAAAPAAARQSIDGLKSGLRSQMQELARDPQVFKNVLQQAFGDKITDGVARDLLARARSGDFPLPETISLVDRSTLRGNNAAYSPENGGTVLLSTDLLGDPRKLLGAFAEEAGHHLDRALGGKDSKGDEGQLFLSSLTKRGRLTADDYRAAMASDEGFIQVAGRTLAVEFQDQWTGVSTPNLTGPVSFGGLDVQPLASGVDAPIGIAVRPEDSISVGFDAAQNMAIYTISGPGMVDRTFAVYQSGNDYVLTIDDPADPDPSVNRHLVVPMNKNLGDQWPRVTFLVAGQDSVAQSELAPGVPAGLAARISIMRQPSPDDDAQKTLGMVREQLQHGADADALEVLAGYARQDPEALRPDDWELLMLRANEPDTAGNMPRELCQEVIQNAINTQHWGAQQAMDSLLRNPDPGAVSVRIKEHLLEQLQQATKLDPAQQRMIADVARDNQGHRNGLDQKALKALVGAVNRGDAGAVDNLVGAAAPLSAVTKADLADRLTESPSSEERLKAFNAEFGKAWFEQLATASPGSPLGEYKKRLGAIEAAQRSGYPIKMDKLNAELTRLWGSEEVQAAYKGAHQRAMKAVYGEFFENGGQGPVAAMGDYLTSDAFQARLQLMPPEERARTIGEELAKLKALDPRAADEAALALAAREGLENPLAALGKATPQEREAAFRDALVGAGVTATEVAGLAAALTEAADELSKRVAEGKGGSFSSILAEKVAGLPGGSKKDALGRLLRGDAFKSILGAASLSLVARDLATNGFPADPLAWAGAARDLPDMLETGQNVGKGVAKLLGASDEALEASRFLSVSAKALDYLGPVGDGLGVVLDSYAAYEEFSKGDLGEGVANLVSVSSSAIALAAAVGIVASPALIAGAIVLGMGATAYKLFWAEDDDYTMLREMGLLAE
ncbi:MAG: hypothetical protein HYV63_13480 [Candidatus Schekmanbacteria bacterium]|nr:hypothetical protein [Candidatus Schekmanbacteria bacterium]